MNRFDVLRDLVTFSQPVNVLSNSLSNFYWDYEGQPLIVTSSEIQSVLKRFLAGEYTAEELETWANLIEGREDLEFEEQKHKLIEHVIYCLANPALQQIKGARFELIFDMGIIRAPLIL